MEFSMSTPRPMLSHLPRGTDGHYHVHVAAQPESSRLLLVAVVFFAVVSALGGAFVFRNLCASDRPDLWFRFLCPVTGSFQLADVSSQLRTGFDLPPAPVVGGGT
jgi:hypothetical protein